MPGLPAYQRLSTPSGSGLCVAREPRLPRIHATCFLDAKFANGDSASTCHLSPVEKRMSTLKAGSITKNKRTDCAPGRLGVEQLPSLADGRRQHRRNRITVDSTEARKHGHTTDRQHRGEVKSPTLASQEWGTLQILLDAACASEYNASQSRGHPPTVKFVDIHFPDL